MAETGNPLSPPLLRGAIVQLMEDLGIVIPNIIPFQYNPEKVTRSFKPWNPFDVDPTKRASPAPMAAPFDPEESYQFTLEFDATNDLEDGNPIALITGVASRIASIQKLVTPSKGLFGDLIASAKALANKPLDQQAERSSIPVALLIFGPGTVLPVRVVSISIEITEFNNLLYPLMANVTLDLRVLTPEAFKCKTTAATGFARSAYEFTRLQEDALAIANFANALSAAKSMLPF
ncbi:MAG: hypothetical protein ACXWUN_01500 [Allosphingosinicella sp.]